LISFLGQKLPSSTSSTLFTPLEDFAWDQGAYNSPLITIYIDLEGVGTVKDGVSVNFTKSSFDVKVLNLNGKNYRLFKENLEKDIIPGNCNYIYIHIEMRILEL
jgi:calcyclin binding protein